MFLKFFKQTLPQVIATIIILTLLLWLKSFLSVQVAPFYFESISMPFFALVSSWLSSNILWNKIFTLVLLLFTGFYLLQINSKHIVIKQRTYLISLFYLLISSSIAVLHQINPAIFAAFFMVFALDHVLSINHKQEVLDNLFKASFFVALASLFYAPTFFYFIAIILSILSIRPFNLREWFASIFGLLTPLFFYFFYFYFFKSDLFYAFDLFKQNLVTEVNAVNSPMLYVYYSYFVLLFAISGVFLIKTLPTQKISVRKYHGVFFWFNLVTLLIVIIIPCVSVEILFIALIPIVFQYTHYFTITTKRFWPNVLFLMVFVLALLMQLYPIE